jgi:protease I
MGCLNGKKILIIVANQDFRDEELFKPKKIFEDNGATVTLAGISTGTAKGMLGGMVRVDSPIAKITADPFDAVVFVGGAGSTVYYDNLEAHRIAKEASRKGKVLGAICLASGTLAKAGLLQGKRATSFAAASKVLKAEGANFTGRMLEVDGKIITGSGPEAATEFGNAIKDALS